MKKLIAFAVISLLLVVGCEKKATSFTDSRFYVKNDKIFTLYLGPNEKLYATEAVYKATLSGDDGLSLKPKGKTYWVEVNLVSKKQ
jgi:hypothetical protein